MKKILTIALFLPFVIVEAQQSLNINNVTGTQSVFESVASGTGGPVKYEDIQGSPYQSPIFQKASVGEKYGNIDVRYNAYTDDIEFLNNGKTEVLPKQDDFSRIEVLPSKQVFIYLKNSSDPKGYVTEVAKGKNSVYKKEKVIFKDAAPAPNTYQTGKPAMFVKQDPVYYVKTASGSISKVSSLKKITDIFPEKEKEYNAYIKSNNLKFNDADIVKLMTFINQ
ncbi:hypothetical protein [Chryseobacterium sediminis]|uniref:Uncharacterized protein n=1 Tax=Chryseobacterium sediminis TaxID=1679494 RepID=A0A5B2U3J2_9FLAO|nr:hypothetical protein [Chryseobacterium sediminis]KAA2221189.1 hypothetical protein FW780_12920 [Chryseobacterium sediminis]